MKNIFNKKGPPVNTSDGSLAKLFQTIVTEDKLTSSIENRVTNYAERTETTRSGKSKVKNNLFTHIHNNKMTFKILVMLLQKVFNVKKIEINVTIFYSKDKVTNHSETLLLSEDQDD